LLHPYGRAIAAWIEKLVPAYEAGDVPEALALLPARTDTDWFRRLRDTAICFIDGRLRFSSTAKGAPFPSMAVYFGTHLARFTAAFSSLDDIWQRLNSSDSIDGKRINAFAAHG
jgi:hypothetical protein